MQGGTSTDVSRFDKSFEHVFDTTISGTTITAPMLDVKTVAAGGGSILFWRNKLFVVGPEVYCTQLLLPVTTNIPLKERRSTSWTSMLSKRRASHHH